MHAVILTLNTNKIVKSGKYKVKATNTWEDTGITITIPKGKMGILFATTGWNKNPLGIGISGVGSDAPWQKQESSDGQLRSVMYMTVGYDGGTYTIWDKRAALQSSETQFYFVAILL